jgi:hypothetical protein
MRVQSQEMKEISSARPCATPPEYLDPGNTIALFRMVCRPALPPEGWLQPLVLDFAKTIIQNEQPVELH